jgi:hypothetical protein
LASRLIAEQGFKEKAAEKYQFALNAPLPTGLLLLIITIICYFYYSALAPRPDRLLILPAPGEDRKLAVKSLASILKGLGLHHEAAAVIAKN